jgi:hypothetical protein
MDPIMQLLAHDKSDKKRFGPLGKAHKIPEDPDTMKAYIRPSEQKSPKKFEFFIRTSGVKSVGHIKQQTNNLNWLKDNWCWLAGVDDAEDGGQQHAWIFSREGGSDHQYL